MDFTPPRRIEEEYRRLINRLFTKHLPLSDLITPESVLRAFANLSRNEGVLNALAGGIANRMVTHLRNANARSWRAAAAEASRGRHIFEALETELHTSVGARVEQLIAENARLISSIPDKVRAEVNHEISRLQLQGLRPEVVSDYLRRRIPRITRERAALIARTETGKAATALTQARSEDLGVEWYQWQTAEDQRVRPAHKLMDGVLVRWNDPPSPELLAHLRSTGSYPPGGTFNCRCVALPLISLSVISWPARVYRTGSIYRMSRARFVDLAGLQHRAA
jgi:SPP1 gp7 family putative phage head morphogenesis protein